MKQLTSEELKKLTAAWQEWTDAPRSDSQKRSRQRLHLVFLLIRYGALRLSEALALNDLKDLDYSTCTIRITGVREREVQVPDRAMQKIRDIVNAPYMFGLRGVITHLDQGYVRKKFYAFSTVCGLDKALVGPQVIRHSRGRELLHNNIPLNIVQKFLGQRSPVQAAGFISFSDEDARRIVHNHLRQETLKRTSARNAFTGTITRVVTGTVSVMVELTTLGNLKVHTLITVESAQRLGIREGMLISATIKAPYVMLARALAAQPKVLLLDEPFSALDPLLRVRMRQEIRQLLDEWNIPVVIITHDPDDVEAFAETLVVYSGGRTVKCVDYTPYREKGTDPRSFLLPLVRGVENVARASA